MPRLEFSSGVVVHYPDGLQLGNRTTATINVNRQVPFPTGPIPISPDNTAPKFGDDLLDAMSDQGLEVMQEINLEPRISPAVSSMRRAVPLSVDGSQTVAVETNLADDEEAVVLSEQDGIFSWHTHIESIAPTTEVLVRGKRSVGKAITFRIELRPLHAESTAAHRGFLTDLTVGAVRAWVLKFAAHTVTGHAVQYLERSARTGFVFLAGEHPEQWQLSATPGLCKLPADRTGRILLLIHGTFSSTVGGFGSLTGTPWGKEFLAASESYYDSIIGFDHYTLRETPRENAVQLLHLLEGFVPAGTQVDVITHSRGGLVFRSLAEMLLPSSKWKPNIGRVIMVASPNAGTLLAEPANWKALIDLYTNLAVGACRLLSLMPQAVAVSSVLKGLVSSLGEFMKYLAHDAADAGGVPGLDAMRVSGEFVNELNETQPGQPAPGALALYAITSEFAPSLAGTGHDLAELPRGLLMVSMGSLIDQLMKEPNDLVVNTQSMTEVDPSAGNFITDQFKFGKTGDVYHTTYFIRPETVNAMTRWLRLEPPATGAKPSMKRSRSSSVAGADIPASADMDISLLNGQDLTGSALSALKASTSSYAVVQRIADGGKKYYYAYKSEELLPRLEEQSEHVNLTEGLGLHEWMGSRQLTVGHASAIREDAGEEPQSRGVVLVGDMPVGVVPSLSDFVSSQALPDLARSITSPSLAKTRAPIVLRTMPTYGTVRITRGPTAAAPPSAPLPASSLSTVEAAAAPSRVPLQIQAEMSAEVTVNKQCSVAVTISRESITPAAPGNVSSTKQGAIADASRALLIQVIPRAQFDIEDDRAEVEVPPPGEPATRYFDLTATDEGVGEVIVLVRQGHAPICTLILKPTIVAVATAATGRLHAETVSDGLIDLNLPLHQLRISVKENGSKTSYRFELFSESLSLLREFESNVIQSDPADYVNGLYAKIENRWLSNKDDQNNFAAELRAFGAVLLNELFPVELQRILWNYRDVIDNILVISTEPFIPWEMVLVKDPDIMGLGQGSRFLAEMGLVRWLYDAGWPPNTIRIRAEKAHYVIPRYPIPQYVLPEAQEEIDDLKKLFCATPIDPQPTPVRECLDKGDFDLLHFACHAEAEGKNVSNGRILLEGRIEGRSYIPATIEASMIAAYANIKLNRPLIVLNACQAGRAGYNLTSTGGFAKSFLRAGASGFVGALWSVDDKSARQFTKAFYKALQANEPVSKAVMLARKEVMGEGNSTWLAYVVYAHPNAKLTSK